MGQRCGIGVARYGVVINDENSLKQKAAASDVDSGASGTDVSPMGSESASVGELGRRSRVGGIGVEYAGTWRHDHYEGHGEWRMLKG